MNKVEINVKSKTHIFILGTQRSGTTWLTNIFDASPDSIVFMEPFAPPTKIFPEFPKTNQFLDDSNDNLDNLIRKEMIRRCLKHKSIIPYSSLFFPNFFPFERIIAVHYKNNQYKGLSKQLKSHMKKFHALNYHKMDKAFPIYQKNRHPNYLVIKELRLAGKLPVFTRNIPDAHYIAIIRHPVATINSILNWFEKKHLAELEKDLISFTNDLESQPISKLYLDEIEICKTGNLSHILALYWRVSYETIISQLYKKPNFHLIIYEEMVNEPHKIVEKLFNELKIPFSHSVDEYLWFSTTNNIQTNNPISTIRKKVDYKHWINQISHQTQKAILEILNNSYLLSYFETYY